MPAVSRRQGATQAAAPLATNGRRGIATGMRKRSRAGILPAMAKRIATYAEFWPYYLGEHRAPLCRGLHYIGSTIAILSLLMFVVSGNPWWLLGAGLGGYGF